MPQYSLLKVLGIVTAFCVTLGLWHTNVFDTTIAILVGLAASSVILMQSRHFRNWIIARSIASTVAGLVAARIYAYGWGDEDKHIQIATAVIVALTCWIITASLPRKAIGHDFSKITPS